MDKKIKFIVECEKDGWVSRYNKLDAEKKMLELFELEEIEEIKVVYKKREPACTADYNHQMD